jgi:hypothetical protein
MMPYHQADLFRSEGAIDVVASDVIAGLILLRRVSSLSPLMLMMNELRSRSLVQARA